MLRTVAGTALSHSSGEAPIMVRGRLSSIPDLESRVFVTRALDSPLLARIVDVGTNQGDLCPEIHRGRFCSKGGMRSQQRIAIRPRGQPR